MNGLQETGQEQEIIDYDKDSFSMVLCRAQVSFTFSEAMGIGFCGCTFLDSPYQNIWSPPLTVFNIFYAVGTIDIYVFPVILYKKV